MEARVSKKEIDDLINKAHESTDTGHSDYPGMSFEEGIVAMYDFLFEDGLNPLSDDK